MRGAASEWERINARFDDRWGASIPLPTNPETKSRAAFDNVQGNGIHARLGTCSCHAVACRCPARPRQL